MSDEVTAEAQPVVEAPASAEAPAITNEAGPEATPEKATDTDDFAVNANDPKGVKARIEKAARRAKAAEAQLAQLSKDRAVVDRFWKLAEEKGLTQEQFVELLESRGLAQEKKTADVSAPEKQEPTGDERRNELAKEFDAESYEALSAWEKRTVEGWIRQEELDKQREFEAKTAQQTTKQREIQETLNDIARDITDTLKDEEFSGIKTDPKAVYDYMVEFSIVDPKVAALAVYKNDLKKHWQSQAEKLVLSRKEKAPTALETTTAVQPSEDFASDDLVKDVVESLKAGGKVDRSLFNT